MKFSDFLLNCDNNETLYVYVGRETEPIIGKCEDFLVDSNELWDREIKSFFSWVDKGDTDSHIEVYIN